MAACSLSFSRSCFEISEEVSHRNTESKVPNSRQLLEASKEFEKHRKALKELATKSDRLVYDAETARDKVEHGFDSCQKLTNLGKTKI